MRRQLPLERARLVNGAWYRIFGHTHNAGWGYVPDRRTFTITAVKAFPADSRAYPFNRHNRTRVHLPRRALYLYRGIPPGGMLGGRIEFWCGQGTYHAVFAHARATEDLCPKCACLRAAAIGEAPCAN